MVGILGVNEDDEVLMVTTGGKIQRIRVADISVVGRNTQGVRIMRMDADDRLASMARIPGEIIEDEPTPEPAAADGESTPGNDAVPDAEASEPQVPTDDSTTDTTPDGDATDE